MGDPGIGSIDDGWEEVCLAAARVIIGKLAADECIGEIKMGQTRRRTGRSLPKPLQTAGVVCLCQRHKMKSSYIPLFFL